MFKEDNNDDYFEKYFYFPWDESNENSKNNNKFEDSLDFASPQNENNIKNILFPILIEEKSTCLNTYIIYPNNMIYNTMKEDKKEDYPPFYSIDKILQNIDETSLDKEIKTKLKEKKKILEKSQNYACMSLTKKKRKREKEEEDVKEKDNIPKMSKDFYIYVQNENKRGRKTEKNNKNYIHDKYKSDNIIKKIKDKLFKSVLKFVNTKLDLKEENELLKLDYDEYINKLKRKRDLDLLKMPLKDFLALKISKKYNKDPYYNKKIIDKILNNIENINVYDNKINKTVNFVFDITFEDYIDICTSKKSLDDLINDYGDYGYTKDNIDYEKIKSNLNVINEISSEVMKKNDVTYLSFFLFYLYNYKRWFYLKRGRKNSSNYIK